MNPTIYDSIGINYTNNRVADIRILESIKNLLDLPTGSTIADIGAGTGNYSNAIADLGYSVKAIEPSKAMRHQATPNGNVQWLTGMAESIPLADDSMDGVIAILSIHHFYSIRNSVIEMRRICSKGPIIIFTLDPREREESWFNNYFPEIYQQELKSFPPILKIAEIVAKGRSKVIKNFLLPKDLADKNMHSGWNNPEIYFDTQFRQNTSGFALASESTVQKGLKCLQRDLRTGKWDKKYGHLREQEFFDAGFRFIKCIP